MVMMLIKMLRKDAIVADMHHYCCWHASLLLLTCITDCCWHASLLLLTCITIVADMHHYCCWHASLSLLTCITIVADMHHYCCWHASLLLLTYITVVADMHHHDAIVADVSSWLVIGLMVVVMMVVMISAFSGWYIMVFYPVYRAWWYCLIIECRQITLHQYR